MGLTKLENGIVEELSKLEIIDCQEHLGPESGHVAMEADGFTLSRTTRVATWVWRG